MNQQTSEKRVLRYLKRRKNEHIESETHERYKYQIESLIKELQYTRYLVVVLLLLSSVSVYVFSNKEAGLVEHVVDVENKAMVPQESEEFGRNETSNPESPALPLVVQKCDQLDGISDGVTELLVNRLLDGNATPEEKSMLSNAIDSYISGLSSQAGAVTINEMVSYFKELKLDRSPKTWIHFDVGKYDIPISGREKLKGICQTIDKSTRTIEVWGHADLTGNEASNLTLAKDRQQNVIQWIKDECKGFKGNIKRNVNYKEVPIATISNQSEPGNRVVIVKI
ncbi:OmpA family protein [Vibrio parahaemolyticus]|uniref:OmpA family protein n=1 Tax=Vibrio parahaemolyticus TaxID=670 RepID=UPI00111F6966|nr:OmpA family protein [Vibrio parahaemolyticus]EJG1583328.1 OmpA family protein [Vibrio parahaemolyticus]TON82779.1 hypothetical protein CGH48_23540 [Vibrio parahaemolyticus]HCE2128380.1 OmpA family protein [Vibrio parahaemolyticus]HCG5531946.1 OmpA family protein [Vibrio parahaemolyticus]HCH0731207.1 OmpA family protein [Vibrio parahaemolyticus]